MGKDLVLQRFFSKKVISNLVETGKDNTFSKVIKDYVDDSDNKTYQMLFEKIYNYLAHHYRTEYYYKNTLLNKFLLKRKYYKTTVAFTELAINNSKADFVIINGHGRVYEIKTELDNLQRLQSQISDYYKAFTLVNVVTYEENVDKIKELIPDSVGIMILTRRGAVKKIRKAVENHDLLNVNVIFKMLHKKEYELILKNCFGRLPQCSDFCYFRECQHLFAKLDVKEAQKFLLQELKKRIQRDQIEKLLQLPESLRLLTYLDMQKENKFVSIEKILTKNYGG